jgi:osomolarity two-component system response regulator SKN7
MEGNRGVDERETPQTESGDSEEYEDEMVLPSTMTYPSPQSGDQAISRIPNLESWDTAGAGHEGLEVYTVGHLMPRGGDGGFMDERSNVFSPEFGGAARFGGSEASGSGSSSNSPPRKQTLRVRRSTFVPGWAVPPRVLLVDDDAVSRKLSSKFLQVFGCTIDVAVDGFGAVNKMNLEKYDLVLMVCSFFLPPLRPCLFEGIPTGHSHAQTGRRLCDVYDPQVRPADTDYLHDE